MVFSVDLGTYNVNKMTQSSLQPTVDFSDVDSDTLSQAVIHTSGFQAGDALNVPPSGDFNVTVNQSARRLHHHHRRQDRHRDARPVRGFRQLDLLLDQQQDRRRTPHRLYGDRQRRPDLNRLHRGHRRVNSYEVSSSQLANGQNTLGSGDDLLHVNTSSFGPTNMGDGHDTVHLAKQGASFGHSEAVKLQTSRRSTPPATAPTRCRCRSTTC